MHDARPAEQSQQATDRGATTPRCVPLKIVTGGGTPEDDHERVPPAA
jgi:hypothetical protein